MSFLTKISQEYTKDNEESLLHSVVNQLILLFSNRNDKYWAWDFEKHKIVAIHEVFQMNYSAPEFAKSLALAIKAFDARLFDIKLSVSVAENIYSVFIECKALYKDIKIIVPKLVFDL
jgi:hypothetical protein